MQYHHHHHQNKNQKQTNKKTYQREDEKGKWREDGDTIIAVTDVETVGRTGKLSHSFPVPNISGSWLDNRNLTTDLVIQFWSNPSVCLNIVSESIQWNVFVRFFGCGVRNTTKNTSYSHPRLMIF